MFEAHLLHLLRRYLGEYVHGLSTEALRISVWKGDVLLKDLKLKAEPLNSLKLPVAVKSGFVGTITLKVPWKSLGKEPVIVLIDRVFVLAYPAPDGRTLKEEDMEKLLETKLQQIEPPAGNSWLGSLIATIIGNLKVSISNVHIRYEDSTRAPLCCGHPLAKLAAVTMDEEGNETFDTSGALDKLRKVILQLAESGSFLGQVDLFKVRGKFALTDAYESHFILPKGKVLMITHRRVILLQQPSNIMGQRKFIPAKDACSIQWDVLWNDLGTMELTDGKKDQPNSPPSRLILYLKSKPHDSKEQVRVVKCSPNTKQAFKVYSAIDQAINLYGDNAAKGMVKNKVTRPYSPISESSWAEGASQQMPASVTPSSTFGTSPTTSSS